MKTKLLFIPLLAVGLLAGCNNGGDPNAVKDYGTIQFDKEDYISEKGSYGGFFSEIYMSRSLANDSTYEFEYSSSYTVDKSFTVSISKPGLASFTLTGETTFDIKTTHGVGDFILTIKNAIGELVYRNVVHVRQSYEIEAVPKALFKVDVYKTSSDWGGYIGDWRLSFISSNPLTGSFAGGDDQDQGVSISFTAEYVQYVEWSDCYLFNVTTTKTNTEMTKLTELAVARCLDVIYVYFDVSNESHLLTVLNASK